MKYEWLSGINHEWSFINLNYMKFFVALKLILVITSVVFLIFYIFQMKKIPYKHWVIEQKIILILSVS